MKEGRPTVKLGEATRFNRVDLDRFAEELLKTKVAS